jgi:ABC-type glycerol-3-phosphate transport system permease component
MRELLKQLFVKDSDMNRRMGEAVRAACLRDGTILVCSVVVLALSAFALCAFRFGFPFDCWSIPAIYSMIFAPTFVVLAAMDIMKRGRTSKRVYSLLCSGMAVGLTATVFYYRMHQFYAA